MYYKARYYDPALGRFITADSVIPGADKTQAFNRYMYVAGNPITYSDPTGHFSFKKFTKHIAGAIVGAATGHSISWWGDKIHDAGKWCDKQWDKVKNTVGSGDWWKEQWHEHEWLRITAYILITAAVIATCILLSPLVFGVVSGYCMLYGALIGASIGFVYGGTNGFTGGWDWENAFKGMAIGAFIGAIIGLCVQYAPPPQSGGEIEFATGGTPSNVPGSMTVYPEVGESTVLSTAPVTNTVGYNSIVIGGVTISIGLGTIKFKKRFN